MSCALCGAPEASWWPLHYATGATDEGVCFKCSSVDLLAEARRLRAPPPMRIPAGLIVGPIDLAPGTLVRYVDDVLEARRAERDRCAKAVALAGPSLDEVSSSFDHGLAAGVTLAAETIRALPDQD